jgi:hypothetical protein
MNAQFVAESKVAVQRLVKIMQEVKLCKTMRLFANVTVKLAKVVGVDLDDGEEGTNRIEIDPAPMSLYRLVTNHTGATDSLFNLSNVLSVEPVAYTDDWLANAWTDADFLIPIQPDGTAFDEFGWMQLG